MTRRSALVIGVSDFDDKCLTTLPGVTLDVVKMRAFCEDASRGAFDSVLSQTSPKKADAHLQISDFFRDAAETDALALLYLATHGWSEGIEGLQLAMRDTRTTAVAATALSLSDIAATIAEHRPQKTILIIDACESGGHTGSVGKLAESKLWNDLTSAASVAPEGHFILAACGTNESAQEGATGGDFTSSILEAVDLVGCDAPSKEWLPTESIGARVLEVMSGSTQRPVWTGLAISLEVPLSKNPHFDLDAAAVGRSLDESVFTASERSTLRPLLLSFRSAFSRIGLAQDWSSDAVSATRAIFDLPVSVSSRELFLEQALVSAGERVAAKGTSNQCLEFVRFAQHIITSVAQAGDSEELINRLVGVVGERSKTISKAFSEWRGNEGWLADGDGPSAFALTSVRFWDALATASFAGLCARACGMGREEESLRRLVSDSLAEKEALHRVVWAGQYPDVIATLSSLLGWADGLVATVSENLLNQLVQEGEPVPWSLSGRALGRELALRAFNQTDVLAQYADEGFASLLVVRMACDKSIGSRDAFVSRLTSRKDAQRLYLYRASAREQLAQATMTVREPMAWPCTKDGASALLHACVDTSCVRHIWDALVCLSASALHRNRSGADVVGWIMSRNGQSIGAPSESAES